MVEKAQVLGTAAPDPCETATCGGDQGEQKISAGDVTKGEGAGGERERRKSNKSSE